MGTLKVAGFIKESIVDGKGIRFVVFAQGCPHHCEGCHNPQTHSFDAGTEVDIDEIIESIKRNPLLSGVTFSGGEPFCQPAAFCELAEKARAVGLDITSYSGYTFEELLEMGVKNPNILKLLNLCDILIDGKFMIDKLDLTLKFRGSSNQRILDVPISLKEGKSVISKEI